MNNNMLSKILIDSNLKQSTSQMDIIDLDFVCKLNKVTVTDESASSPAQVTYLLELHRYQNIYRDRYQYSYPDIQRYRYV